MFFNVFQSKGIPLKKKLNHSGTKSKLRKLQTMCGSVRYLFSDHIFKGCKEQWQCLTNEQR